MTTPFLLRDIAQLITTPPIVNEPLPSFPSRIAYSQDEAILSHNIIAKLIESRAVVSGGSIGWTPRTNILLEKSPLTLHMQDADTYSGNSPLVIGRDTGLPVTTVPYRFAVRFQNLPAQTTRALIASDPGAKNITVANCSITPGRNENEHEVTGWIPVPSGDTDTPVFAGIASPSDARILAQFPLPGKIGFSRGAKAQWLSPSDNRLTQVEIVLPDKLRPYRSNKYELEVQEIDFWGNVTSQGTRTISVTPLVKRFRIPIYGVRQHPGTQSIRLIVTPYRWAMFPDVSLTIPEAEKATFNPIPITQEIERVRQQLKRNTNGFVASSEPAFYEVAYLKPEELTHPQLAHYVPNSIVISHSRQKQEYQAPEPKANESYFYADLPVDWNENAGQMTVFVTTKGHKSVQATRQQTTLLSDQKSCRVEWKLFGVEPDNIKTVSFGFTH